jgi:carboxyl-terminal processing protease
MNRAVRVAVSFAARVPGRRLAPAFAVAGLAVLSCSPITPYENGAPAPGHVLTVGFENLASRYIDRVRPETLALTALGGLSNVDPDIAVARSDGSVRLTLAGHVLSERGAPGDEDVRGWAWLAAAALDDARRTAPAVRASNVDALYKAVFEGALAGFDRYSRYTEPEIARRNRASRDGFGGLGITIDQDDGITVVARVHEGTPAAAAGLKVDDRITHVDGRDIHALPLAQVVTLLRGSVDEPVVLTIERTGHPAPMPLRIVRSHIVVPTVHTRREGNVLDIKISGFNQGTASALRAALIRNEKEMGGDLKGVILDLRGNPGGLLDQAVAVADLFLGRGRIVFTKGRHPDSDQIFDATPGELVPGKPLIVLVNGRSASAAEIVAVALRDSGRAVVIGSSTFGKGTVQTIIPLPNGGEMVLTWARIHAPSGQTLDRQGIVPTICTSGEEQRVEATMKAIEAASAGRTPLVADHQYRPQAGQPHYSETGLETCPPSPAQSANDLRAARLLLDSAPLYAQALNTGASVARIRPQEVIR